MKLFEYCVAGMGVPVISGVPVVMGAGWQKLGAEGWELVGVTAGSGAEVLGWFKRVLPDKEALKLAEDFARIFAPPPPPSPPPPPPPSPPSPPPPPRKPDAVPAKAEGRQPTKGR